MKEYKLKDYITNKGIQEGIIFFTLSISLILYSLFNHYNAGRIEWRISPYLFPLLIAVFILPFSLFLLHYGIKKIKSKSETKDKEGSTILKTNVLVTVALSVLYCYFITFIGFVPASVLFLASLIIYLKEKRTWLIALISLLFSFSIYFIFAVLLNVMLP